LHSTYTLLHDVYCTVHTQCCMMCIAQYIHTAHCTQCIHNSATGTVAAVFYTG